MQRGQGIERSRDKTAVSHRQGIARKPTQQRDGDGLLVRGRHRAQGSDACELERIAVGCDRGHERGRSAIAFASIGDGQCGSGARLLVVRVRQMRGENLGDRLIPGCASGQSHECRLTHDGVRIGAHDVRYTLHATFRVDPACRPNRRPPNGGIGVVQSHHDVADVRRCRKLTQPQERRTPNGGGRVIKSTHDARNRGWITHHGRHTKRGSTDRRIRVFDGRIEDTREMNRRGWARFFHRGEDMDARRRFSSSVAKDRESGAVIDRAVSHVPRAGENQ